MGHRDKVKKLGRTKPHREAMLANMAMSLFTHRMIKTTDAKAKAPDAPTIRSGTKQAQVIALLQRPDGAAISEIVAETGWQAHYADARIMPM